MTNAAAHEVRAFTFALPSDSRVANAATTYAALQAGLRGANTLVVQGNEVVDADAATVQLLLLMQRELKSRGGALQLQSLSVALQSAIHVAGADHLLLAN
jgi:hypothetical protein